MNVVCWIGREAHCTVYNLSTQHWQSYDLYYRLTTDWLNSALTAKLSTSHPSHLNQRRLSTSKDRLWYGGGIVNPQHSKKWGERSSGSVVSIGAYSFTLGNAHPSSHSTGLFSRSPFTTAKTTTKCFDLLPSRCTPFRLLKTTQGTPAVTPSVRRPTLVYWLFYCAIKKTKIMMTPCRNYSNMISSCGLVDYSKFFASSWC